MNSIFLISLANLRRRKRQSFLIGICMALASLLFCTTIGLMQHMHRPFDTLFEQLRASHILLFFDPETPGAEEWEQWWSQQAEVEAVTAAHPMLAISDPVIFEENELDLMVQLMEHTEIHLHQDQVVLLQGESKSHPELGEIWIPNHVALSHGIEIGDSLGISNGDGLVFLQVSGIVVDPHYASGLFNPTRMWVAPGELSFLFPVSQLNEQVMGIRLENPEQISLLWARFHQAHRFTGNKLDYHLFKSVFLSFYQLISAVLLVFSVMAILVALFIMFSALVGAIRSDLRLIGTYQALGYTPSNIFSIYLLQSLLLALVSVPVGLVASYWATQGILGSLLASLGMVELQLSLWQPMLLTLGVFLILVGGLTWIGSRKARQLKPVEAIRNEGESKMYFGLIASPWFVQGRMPGTWFMGLRMMLAHPMRMMFTGLSLLFVIFVLVFSINVAHSFSQLKENKAAWGLEDSDVQVRLNQRIALPMRHETFLKQMQQHASVKAVVPFSYTSAMVPVQRSKRRKS